MEVMELELWNTLRTSDKLLTLYIHTKPSTSNAKINLELTGLTVLLSWLDAHKSSIKFKEAQWLSEWMQATGKLTLQVFSIIVDLPLTMLSLWLDQVTMHGQSRTLGALLGDNKVTSDWPREIHVVYALDHHSLFDCLSIKNFTY